MRLAGPQDMAGVFDVRRQVFAVEQGIRPADEWDGLDEEAIHAVGVVNGAVVGTGRSVRSGAGHEVRIGRMAVLPAYRRSGIGMGVLKVLEEEAIRSGAVHAVLHAQTYVKSFYEDAGYRESGEPFVEAGIEHVTMVKALVHARLDEQSSP